MAWREHGRTVPGMPLRPVIAPPVPTGCYHCGQPSFLTLYVKPEGAWTTASSSCMLCGEGELVDPAWALERERLEPVERFKAWNHLANLMLDDDRKLRFAQVCSQESEGAAYLAFHARMDWAPKDEAEQTELTVTLGRYHLAAAVADRYNVSRDTAWFWTCLPGAPVPKMEIQMLLNLNPPRTPLAQILLMKLLQL